MAIKDLKLVDSVSSILTAAGVRAGHVNITSLITSIDVTFSSAMPDANYETLLYASGLSVAFTISSKLTTGFTVSFTAGITATLSYIAIGGI